MTRINPAAMGFDAAQLKQIDAVMQGYVDSGKIAGHSTLIARRGRIVHFESYGYADMERKRPMAEDTIFRIFSMSKPITVVAALILYERGLFGLNDPIGDFIPSFKDMTVLDGDNGDVVPAARPVTIRHLMTHTAGISYDGEGTPAEGQYAELQKYFEEKPSTADGIDALAGIPLLFQPGERWHYGLSIDVVGRLVEVVSGKQLGEFLEDELFRPLGMTDSGFAVPQKKAGRLAALYAPADENRKDLDGNIKLLEDPEKSRWLKTPSFEEGGGGLVSTIGDYARFAVMLAAGGTLEGTRILGPKTVELMAGDHIGEQPKLDYDWAPHQGYTMGLGVRVMENLAEAGSNGSIGEFGWAGLAGTWVWIDPKEELAAVYMPQLIPDFYYPAARQFSTIMYSALSERG